MSGKRVLMVIAPENFRDEELLHTKEELERAGAETTIASSKTGVVKGLLGATVTPDFKLDQVNVDDYDAIVFVGGPVSLFQRQAGALNSNSDVQQGQKNLRDLHSTGDSR